MTLFPDPRKCRNPEGILATGGELTPEILLEAYGSGIFPWPVDDCPLLWFCPPQRGILRFEKLHIPKSLAKAKKKLPFRYTLNQAFPAVIQACAEIPRPDQEGTWITTEMLEAYVTFHRLGHAHSVEVWQDNDLVGGIYGVWVGGVFSAESMFHRRPYASKLAFLFLVEHLKSKGLEWIDIQVMTPHMEALGAELISRDSFLKMLKEQRGSGPTYASKKESE